VMMVLNHYQYNNGHLLVAPRRHTAELAEMTDAEQLALAAGLTRAIAALRRLMSPEGFNIGLNLGKVAGAGLPNHLHWHVVPRWKPLPIVSRCCWPRIRWLRRTRRGGDTRRRCIRTAGRFSGTGTGFCTVPRFAA